MPLERYIFGLSPRDLSLTPQMQAHAIPFLHIVENQTVAGFSINKQGRSYICGKSVDGSLRCVIIDSILVEGGDLTSGYFEGYFKEVADQYRATGQFVSKLWKTVCETGIICPLKRKLETLVNSSQRMSKRYTYRKSKNLPKAADQSKKISIRIVLWMAG